MYTTTIRHRSRVQVRCTLVLVYRKQIPDLFPDWRLLPGYDVTRSRSGPDVRVIASRAGRAAWGILVTDVDWFGLNRMRARVPSRNPITGAGIDGWLSAAILNFFLRFSFVFRRLSLPVWITVVQRLIGRRSYSGSFSACWLVHFGSRCTSPGCLVTSSVRFSLNTVPRLEIQPESYITATWWPARWQHGALCCPNERRLAVGWYITCAVSLCGGDVVGHVI